jgi:hypothetical protein
MPIIEAHPSRVAEGGLLIHLKCFKYARLS